MKRIEKWRPADERSVEFLNACKKAVQEIVSKADVILFGSRARHQELPDSDYDLLVLFKTEDTPSLKQKVRDALYDLALEYDVVVSTFIYSRQRWESFPWRSAPLHERVEEEGILV